MKFLVDEQLPLALARAIAATGVEAAHITDFGLAGSADPVIWQRVCRDEWIVVTKDADFVRLQRALQTGTGRVLWVRLGNCRKPVLLSAVIPALPTIIELFERGDWIVEVV